MSTNGLRKTEEESGKRPWPRNLKVLAAAAFTLSLGVTSFSRFSPAYLRDRGVPLLWIGLFFSLSSTVGAALAPVGGVLADIWGRRPLLVAGRAFAFLGWVSLLSSNSTAGLALAGVLSGLGWLAASSYRTMIAESALSGGRAMAFALTGSLENTAAILAPVAVGFLSDRFGLRPVMALALLPYLVGIIVTSGVKETLVHHDAGRAGDTADQGAPPLQASRPAVWSGLSYLSSHAGRGALLMSVIWVFTGLSVGLSQPLWTLFMKDKFGATYGALGVMNSAISFGSVVGQLTGGRAADRFGYSRVMMTSLCTTISLWALIPAVGTAALYALLAGIFHAGGWLAVPAWEAIGAEAATRRVRGAVSGIYSGAFSIGMAVGSALFGLVYTRSRGFPFYLLLANDCILLALVLIGVKSGLRGFARRSPDD